MDQEEETDDFLAQLEMDDAVATDKSAHHPSVCIDSTSGGDAPTRLDITGTASLTEGKQHRPHQSRTAAGPRKSKRTKRAAAGNGTGDVKRQKRATADGGDAVVDDDDKEEATPEEAAARKIETIVNRSRMSATDEAFRDTARSDLPAPVRERILTSENTSFITADPTRGEEKATLASMATSPGTRLSEVEMIHRGEEVPKKTRRGKRRRTATGGGARKKRGGSLAEPVVHRLEDIPESAKDDLRSEGREAREIDKHPGKVKTAGLGVAIPPPGRRESQLRKNLDASALSRRESSDQRPQPPPLDSSEGMETESAAEVAARLDARRMGVGYGAESSTAVQPISQLTTAFADQNRLTLSDVRTALAQYFSGLVEQKCLEVNAAALAIRRATYGDDRDSQAQHQDGRTKRAPNTAALASGNASGGASRKIKTLVLNATEKDICTMLCESIPPAAPLSRLADDTGPEALCLPRLGLGNAVDMPIHEAELAVLRGGATIREAMVYFMRPDDTVAAMESAYRTACELTSIVDAADALHPAPNGDVRARMVTRLRAREGELDSQWEIAAQDDRKDLWMERYVTRVLIAILTGELRNQRHSIIRTLVAKEESLLELYQEPAQRCFLSDDDDGTDDVGTDADVIATMRRTLSKLGAISDDADSADKPASAVLPDLGTPASKAYCADFLRAPDPDNSLERPCAHGERSCVAWLTASQSAWPSTGALNRGARAFVMREFHPPDRWQKIQQSGTLPTHRAKCLMCSRFSTTYFYIQLRLLDAFNVLGVKDPIKGHAWRGLLLGQNHWNLQEDESGYTESDMLPVCRPTNGPWTGIVAPIVAFRGNSYILGETTLSGGSESPGQQGKTLPCFFERRAVDFR